MCSINQGKISCMITFNLFAIEKFIQIPCVDEFVLVFS